jgi:hypothetical protein
LLNIIFTYKATAVIPKELQLEIDKVQFVEIPEMQRVEEIVSEEVTLVAIPYQATVTEAVFATLSNSLSNYGELTIIGKWVHPVGSIIELYIQKYCNALNDIQVFEKAVFIDGVDFTGKENEFEPIQKTDENEELIFMDDLPVYQTPVYRRFTRELPSSRPTLEQAKHIQVNVFNATYKRDLE